MARHAEDRATGTGTMARTSGALAQAGDISEDEAIRNADGINDLRDRTRDAIRRIQDDGTCWLSGTTWHGVAAMRISVINWSTTEADIDRSVAAVLRAVVASR